jgi:F0F1-type ATP synthase assembly protein I
MLTLGLVGWLIDMLVGTSHVFFGIGIVLGGAGGVYAVYLRYGKEDQ